MQVAAYFDSTGLGGNLGSLDDWAGVVASLEDVPAEGYEHLHHLVENGWEDDLPALEDEIAECLSEHTKGEAHETLEELLDVIESRGEDDEAVALGLDDGSTLNLASLANLLDNANPSQPRGDDGRFMEASRHELLQAIKRGFGPLLSSEETAQAVEGKGKNSTDEEDEAEEAAHSPEAVMESLPAVNNLVLNSLAAVNVFCATGPGGGQDPHCSPGGKESGKGGGVRHSLNRGDIGDDQDVELYDTKNGEVLWAGRHSEAKQLVKEQAEVEGGVPEGLGIRLPGETDRQVGKAPVEQKAEGPRPTHTPAGIPIPDNPKPGQPGGKDWVDPPAKLYHATYSADDIVGGGFKTADQLGKQVLGGSKTDSTSFTTKENAEVYRDGLDVARRAARGELSFTREELTSVARRFGVKDKYHISQIWKQANEGQQASEGDAKKWFNALQRVSLEGRIFPLFMGGNWPDGVKTAKPPQILEIDSRGPERYSYNKGETEWRIEDTSKIREVRVAG